MTWRVRGRPAFARLASDGRRIRAGALWCTFLLDVSAAPPRVAFSLRRDLGSAPRRNRLRRRLRVLVAAADLPPGWYLIGARPAAVEQSFDALRHDMATLTSGIRASSSASSSPTSA